MIPIVDVTAQYLTLQHELDAAMRQVLAGGQFILGPNVTAFENEVASYLDVPYAVGLNSGTDALVLALRALDIGPGDEVITTPFSFAATSEAIASNGARAVFADIDPATFNLDPAAVAAAVTPKTQAIIVVHLFGQPARMEEIGAIASRHGLAVVEDCAQAFGATAGPQFVGTIGDIGCFSFFPSKNLGAYGDGGMITTRSEAIARRVRALRAHGAARKYYHDELGMNSRLDELQAALLRIKLPHVQRWNEMRAAVAKRYREGLKGRGDIALPVETPGTRHVYHQFTVRVPERDHVRERLLESFVQTMVYYPLPLHLQPVHRELGYSAGDFPEAEAAARGVLSLPMFPELSAGDQDTVIDRLRELVPAAVA
ncbi:MAG: DegT/DnrJ/EryC1/StrS family aminotransferase [Candidatus Eremiobacteraeota bacterium]|nr:DegT/DnrJ/EryC1/StrS family aminotransferase [Candidatus Eremiobacteraeota bacterium]MBV8366666.1 DegT/DnrJ/EryC1/StrS family aminotransferase [Candidatus Eremiobacteraeota bacterium]